MSRHTINEKPADPLEEYLRNLTRRRFFGSMASTMGAGMGAAALSSMLTDDASAGITTSNDAKEILSNLPHYAPKAKQVIYMHMEGAPSQLDLYDYKPQLQKHFDEDLPDSIRNGQRITDDDQRPKTISSCAYSVQIQPSGKQRRRHHAFGTSPSHREHGQRDLLHPFDAH